MATMQAFAVLENFENTGGIVFATSAVAARRRGAEAFADGEFSGVSCRRARWADKYADVGSVPASLMVAHGWRYEGTCGHLVAEDELAEKGITCDEVVGYDNGGAVFCSTRCESEHARVMAVKAAVAEETCLMLREVLATRLPGIGFPEQPKRYDVDVVLEDGHAGWRSASTSFSFPGMSVGLASANVVCRHGLVGPPELGIYCCSGDRTAFQAFAEKQAARSRS